MNNKERFKINEFQKKVCFQQKHKIRPGMAFRVFDFDTKKSLDRSFSSADASDMSKTSFVIKRANTFVLVKEQEVSVSKYLERKTRQTVMFVEKNNPIFSCLSSESFSELEKSEVFTQSYMNEISENWLWVPATMSDEEVRQEIVNIENMDFSEIRHLIGNLAYIGVGC